jgi:hypothetical protein
MKLNWQTITIVALVLVVMLSVITRMPSSGDVEEEISQENIDLEDKGVKLMYLDNTQVDNYTYKVRITGTTDYGVLIVKNIGEVKDEYALSVNSTGGVTAALDKSSISLDNRSLTWCIITYSVAGDAGTHDVIITAVSKSNPNVRANITLQCEIANPEGVVTQKGDQVYLAYHLTDENGTVLDEGTLPAIAGEQEAGPLGQVSYIDGFYLGLLGMEKGGPLDNGQYESKQIRVPPEMAYGVDSGHELSDMYLIFTQTLEWSQ